MLPQLCSMSVKYCIEHDMQGCSACYDTIRRTCLLEQGECPAQESAAGVTPKHDARLLVFSLDVMLSFPVEVPVAVGHLASCDLELVHDSQPAKPAASVDYEGSCNSYVSGVRGAKEAAESVPVRYRIRLATLRLNVPYSWSISEKVSLQPRWDCTLNITASGLQNLDGGSRQPAGERWQVGLCRCIFRKLFNTACVTEQLATKFWQQMPWRLRQTRHCPGGDRRVRLHNAVSSRVRRALMGCSQQAAQHAMSV